MEANNGEALRDQLEKVEAKLAYTEKKHDEYLTFTELEVQNKKIKNACFSCRELNKNYDRY